jgi:hypothetical protein
MVQLPVNATTTVLYLLWIYYVLTYINLYP